MSSSGGNVRVKRGFSFGQAGEIRGSGEKVGESVRTNPDGDTFHTIYRQKSEPAAEEKKKEK